MKGHAGQVAKGKEKKACFSTLGIFTKHTEELNPAIQIKKTLIDFQ